MTTTVSNTTRNDMWIPRSLAVGNAVASNYLAPRVLELSQRSARGELRRQGPDSPHDLPVSLRKIGDETNVHLGPRLCALRAVAVSICVASVPERLDLGYRRIDGPQFGMFQSAQVTVGIHGHLLFAHPSTGPPSVFVPTSKDARMITHVARPRLRSFRRAPFSPSARAPSTSMDRAPTGIVERQSVSELRFGSPAEHHGSVALRASVADAAAGRAGDTGRRRGPRIAGDVWRGGRAQLVRGRRGVRERVTDVPST